MAVKDSNEIATDSNYSLGDYNFHVERSAGTSPNYDKIEAICTKDGKNARKSIQVDSRAKFNGYYVEANGTEATVYAVLEVPDLPEGEEGEKEYEGQTVVYTSPEAAFWEFGEYHSRHFAEGVSGESEIYAYTWAPIDNPTGIAIGFCSLSPFSGTEVRTYIEQQQEHRYEHHFTANQTYDSEYQQDYYWYTLVSGDERMYEGLIYAPPKSIIDFPTYTVDEILLFAGREKPKKYKTTEIMVGRFKIELEDAGGVGPGSDWVDPGDYDPDWEEGDPTHTLYVTVTGALSGRHNDPIVDPSYSYIPADKDTVKDYGCGGDGGHGGGGGAGASTVVVHKFATNQANSKEVTAIARRHGYGSGGGKGGKGGDGCILVYY